MIPFEIRAASDADQPEIETLLRNSDLPTSGVKESLDGFLVAEVQGSVVGAIGLEERSNYGLLRSTVVVPAWRGKHVAGELVERMIAAARARRLEALYLLTTTAERYFPRFGFTVTTRDSVPDAIKATDEFTDACPATATVMCLRLGGQRSTEPARNDHAAR